MKADRFNHALKSLHWSEETLASMLGCDISLIEAYANGQVEPPPKLSAWLEVLAQVHEDLADQMPTGLVGKRYNEGSAPPGNLLERSAFSSLDEETSKMTQHVPPTMREPKGDHNRRLSLGMEPEQFAAAAGITVEQLRAYELTGPDQDYDMDVADRVGWALERLEANPPNSQKVIN